MAGTEERKSVFYLQQICSDIKRNVFKTPWGSVLIHNCDETGKLLDFKSVQEFKDSCKSLWLNMKLLIFKKDHGEFPVWCCPECPSMRGVWVCSTIRRTSCNIFVCIPELLHSLFQIGKLFGMCAGDFTMCTLGLILY